MTIGDASRDDAARLIDQEGWICGASVEAHRIAALVGGGMRTDEVLADYPNLDAAQVEAAVRFAARTPDARQFPTVTAKSVSDTKAAVASPRLLQLHVRTSERGDTLPLGSRRDEPARSAGRKSTRKRQEVARLRAR